MKKIFTLFVAAMAMFSVANAQLAYNQAFTQADFNNAATVVVKEGEIAWDNTNGIRLGGSATGPFSGPAWNWDDKYVIIALESGRCTSLSFTTGLTSSSSTAGIGGNGFWYVAAGSTQDALTNIWAETSKNNPGAVNLDLDENVRFVKICFTGNFAGYVKNLIIAGVKEVKTYGEYNAAFCTGDSIEYNGVWYKEAFSGDVTLTEKNYLGFDSIVTLTVKVNPTFLFEDEQIVIEEGTDGLWHEIQLSELEVGEHVLYDSLTVAETGCDSVWSVIVVVSAKQIIPTAIDETMVAPAATKFFRNGCLYIRRGEALYDMSGRKVK